jgi:hypothetical protein
MVLTGTNSCHNPSPKGWYDYSRKPMEATTKARRAGMIIAGAGLNFQ